MNNGHRNNAPLGDAKPHVDGERPAGEVDWFALAEGFCEPLGATTHDGVLRGKDDTSRCMAATASGKRCRRRARIRSMCVKCLRREAPLWRRRSAHATGS